MRINFNHFQRFATIIALGLLVCQSALAQNPSTSQPSAQQIAAKVDEYMNAAVKVDGFNGSVLIARDGQPVISKGYGMANIELNVPNTPQTVFRIGSLTKSFTAMAIMMLQEQGKLNTIDSMCKYLDNCPAAWQPITIHHLLTHTSGIPNYTSFSDFRTFSLLPTTHEIFINRLKDKPLESAPGEKWKYYNSGFYLLGVIIERTSGKPYVDFLQENIFTPLGMKNTFYESHARIIKNRAAGYEGQGEAISNARYIDGSNTFAAGALLSTMEDLLLWDKALYTEKFVSRKSLDAMFTPFKESSPGRGYAYAWWVEKQFDRQALSHSGHVNGFSSYITRFPSERVTVIVLGNNINAPSERITKDLSAIVFGSPYKIPEERKTVAVASTTLDKYAGKYSVLITTATITNENGKLMMEMPGQPKAELSAASETEFFIKMTDIQVKFVMDAQGKVTGAVVRRRGQDIPAQKIQ